MERKDKLFTELYPDDDDGFEEGRPLCAYAAQFRQWADQLCAEHCGSVLEIAQAKVLLLDKYLDWKNFVPRITAITAAIVAIPVLLTSSSTPIASCAWPNWL